MLYFTKLTFLLWRGNQWKTLKQTPKQRFKINVFFDVDFQRILEPSWVNLGAELGFKNVFFWIFFSSCVRKASRRRPRGAQERPRASQERPKSVPRASKSAQESSKSVRNCPKSHPTVQNCRKLLKIGENYAKLLGIAKNQQNSLKIYRNSKEACKSLRVQKRVAHREIWTPNDWMT